MEHIRTTKDSMSDTGQVVAAVACSSTAQCDDIIPDDPETDR